MLLGHCELGKVAEVKAWSPLQGNQGKALAESEQRQTTV